MSETMKAIQTDDGRRFVCIGAQPYTRKDGSETALLVWQAQCVECGAPFTIKTPHYAREASDSKAFGRKRCDAHKLTREQAAANWGAAIAKARRLKVSP
jgi:hypothetical protein